ncbi:putative peroxiredoxin [Lupinus albus]|uniref:thioredoxin-dependent peroxiredoxin n=1 Tax=Lupinus albus TaxID=3870 RepID=A0A6A4PHY0_LUPAL|nr:putative peroxiredoxin [Lupinus albus]
MSGSKTLKPTLSMDEVLRVIESLQKTSKFKVATPANWKPGKKVVISPHVTNGKLKRCSLKDLRLRIFLQRRSICLLLKFDVAN